MKTRHEAEDAIPKEAKTRRQTKTRRQKQEYNSERNAAAEVENTAVKAEDAMPKKAKTQGGKQRCGGGSRNAAAERRKRRMRKTAAGKKLRTKPEYDDERN
ncbi:MAG: hypothetical protein ACLRM8_01080 [Alistipes sp.]